MFKILFFIPRLDYGSAENQLTLLAQGLHARGCAVQVCAFGGGRAATILQQAGVAVDILGDGRPHDPRPAYRLYRRLRTFAPDIVHTWRPQGNALGRALARFASRAAVVATAHVPEDVADSWGRWFQRWLHRRTARWIVPCEALAEAGLPRDQQAIIAPAVAVPVLTPGEPDVFWKALGIPSQGRIILCVTRLILRKGVKNAIWSLDILKFLYDDLYLVIVGDGPERPALEQFAADLRALDRVRFVRPLEDLAELMRLAEIVWVPSLADGVPQVALEAMAHGRPLVASRLPGIAAVVPDGQAGFLVAPNDKAALARQTRLLLDRPDLRQQIGEAGRQHVALCFRPDRMVAEHLELYRQVVQQRP